MLKKGGINKEICKSEGPCYEKRDGSDCNGLDVL
jgi:hypothetical protein